MALFWSFLSLVGDLSDFLQVSGRGPAFRVGVGGDPDVPPARAPDLDQLDRLVLGQVDLATSQGHVVGQNKVTVAGSMPRHSPAPLTTPAQITNVFTDLKVHLSTVLVIQYDRFGTTFRFVDYINRIIKL